MPENEDFEQFKYRCEMRFHLYENAFESRMRVLTILNAVAYALIGYLLARTLI